MVIDLPEKAYKLLKRFYDNGHKAYLVGGAVRDILLQRDYYDFDVCTDALPVDTALLFSDCKLSESSVRFGTVTVIFEGSSFEITTMRRESAYGDSRHPNKVEFTDKLEEDLARRDFTVNALAADMNGNVYDPFGGINDLKNKIIKTVGNPDIRLNEDNLRVARALRFAVCLEGFSIDKKTLEACLEIIENGVRIPPDASGNEFKKTLPFFGENAKSLLPFFSLFSPHFSVSTDTLTILNGIASNDLSMRAAVLFKDASPFIATEFLQSCGFSKKAVNEVGFLLESDALHFESIDNVIDFYLKYGMKNAERYFEFARVTQRPLSVFNEARNVILSGKRPICEADLAIRGNDLSLLNLSGKEIGAALKLLLTEAAHGRLINEKETLLGYLKSNFMC